MGDCGNAAQEILHAADQQPLIARHGHGHFEFRIVSPQRIDVGDPIACVSIELVKIGACQTIELQVVMRIDEARQHPVALQIDDRIGR